MTKAYVYNTRSLFAWPLNTLTASVSHAWIDSKQQHARRSRASEQLNRRALCICCSPQCMLPLTAACHCVCSVSGPHSSVRAVRGLPDPRLWLDVQSTLPARSVQNALHYTLVRPSPLIGSTLGVATVMNRWITMTYTLPEGPKTSTCRPEQASAVRKGEENREIMESEQIQQRRVKREGAQKRTAERRAQ